MRIVVVCFAVAVAVPVVALALEAGKTKSA
jgi:hypothetical protein